MRAAASQIRLQLLKPILASQTDVAAMYIPMHMCDRLTESYISEKWRILLSVLQWFISF